MSELNSFWKTLTNNRQQQDASIYLVYDLLRGRNPKQSGFSKITNKMKLAHGFTEYNGLRVAAINLRWALTSRNENLAQKLCALAGACKGELAKQCEELSKDT